MTYRRSSEPVAVSLVSSSITVFVTVLIMIGTAVGLVFSQSDMLNPVPEQEIREELDSSNMFREKTAELAQIEDGLEDLLAFVEEQQDGIAEMQNKVQRLEEEIARLEPIAKADREAVEAIFEYQEAKAKRTRWVDRGLGFLSGLLTELFVAVIIAPWAVPKLKRTLGP